MRPHTFALLLSITVLVHSKQLDLVCKTHQAKRICSIIVRPDEFADQSLANQYQAPRQNDFKVLKEIAVDSSEKPSYLWVFNFNQPTPNSNPKIESLFTHKKIDLADSQIEALALGNCDPDTTYLGDVEYRLYSDGGLVEGYTLFDTSLPAPWATSEQNFYLICNNDVSHILSKDELASRCGDRPVKAYTFSTDGTNPGDYHSIYYVDKCRAPAGQSADPNYPEPIFLIQKPKNMAAAGTPLITRTQSENYQVGEYLWGAEGKEIPNDYPDNAVARLTGSKVLSVTAEGKPGITAVLNFKLPKQDDRLLLV